GSSGGSSNGGGSSGGGNTGATVTTTPAPTPTPTPAPAPIPMLTPTPSTILEVSSALSLTERPQRVSRPTTVVSSKMKDIAADHWAAVYIDGLVERGIISGYPQPDGTFKYEPDNEITRAELMKLIAVALDLELIENYDGSAFADWDSIEEWAKPYIAALIEAKIVLGSQEDGGVFLFANNSITREEMIVMVMRALGVNPSGSTANYPDVGEVSDWAADSVAFAYENGMINIYSDGSANPAGNAKRDETAMLLYMLIK
ncbi:MAG: S-layer homology domain-containing protein, partial [Oscillospiraceae bacterium]|nr:S-layer homology domain-containing protein [Oscillospiraceae bacterium]